MVPISRGIPLLVPAGVVAGFASPRPTTQASPPHSAPDGLRLLRQMQDALGGARQIAAVRDVEETIRAQAWDASGDSLGEVRKRTRWMRTPNVIRLDQRGPLGTYVLYFDGSSGSGWELLPDLRSPDPYKTTGQVARLAGGELEFARGYLDGFELNQWLADQKRGYKGRPPRHTSSESSTAPTQRISRSTPPRICR